MPSADGHSTHAHRGAPTYGQRRELYRSERIVTRYHGGTRQHIARTGPPQWIRNEARAFRAMPLPRTARRAYRDGASYADGSRYMGGLHNGLPHGHGQMHYADGSSYSGAFHRGLPHGQGTYRTALGDVLTGSFQNGVIQTGQARYVTGHTYSGPFLAGSPHGQGAMTYADGGSYQGAFQSGRPDGWGTYRDARGQAFQGTWNRGAWADAPVLRYDDRPQRDKVLRRYTPQRRPRSQTWR